MSGMRVTGGASHLIAQQLQRPKAAQQAQQNEETQKSQAPDANKEAFISSLSSRRQPPQMSLGTLFSGGPNSVLRMFPAELDALEQRDVDEVAGDLAMTYLRYAKQAEREGDADLVEAFEAMGELMRGYEHLRMLKTGDLG